jgi:tRNA pseudouridine32 synthase/23S rRNA pseudouridine746 synthase/23S rRNA pseudouridine1911/1915/1917 synthase
VSDWDDIQAGRVLLADEAALVLNKPAGVSVMGERHGTDLVRLATAAGEELFPVHRIDKVTSGAVLFARELRWHGDLTRQFARQAAGKAYLAITRPGGLPAQAAIDLPLSVGRKNRVRVAAPRAAIEAGEDGWTVPEAAVFTHVRHYPSVTEITTLWQDDQYALVLARPVTGRRHQIRVHLAWTGHPVLGDPLFGASGLPRAHLHSWRLAFTAAWRRGDRIEVEAPPGTDFWAPLAVLLPDPAALLSRSATLHPNAPPAR